MTIKRDDVNKIDFSGIAAGDRIPLITPGDILREEFLDPMGITAYRLAKEIHVPTNRITHIINGERAISADTALRLSKYFGMSAGFWLNLQVDYDLRIAEQKAAEDIATIQPYAA